MFNREGEPPQNKRYKELRLRALEHQIDDAGRQLGEIYAGPRVSNKNYATIAKKLLKESAVMLFEMQLFPVVGIQDRPNPERTHNQKVRDCKLGFSTSDGTTHYLDLEGRILSHPETTETVSDPNWGEIILLSKDLLVPVDDTGYRRHAGGAFEAIRDRARAHWSKIEPPRPIFNTEDVKLLAAA